MQREVEEILDVSFRSYPAIQVPHYAVIPNILFPSDPKDLNPPITELGRERVCDRRDREEDPGTRAEGWRGGW